MHDRTPRSHRWPARRCRKIASARDGTPIKANTNLANARLSIRATRCGSMQTSHIRTPSTNSPLPQSQRSLTYASPSSVRWAIPKQLEASGEWSVGARHAPRAAVINKYSVRSLDGPMRTTRSSTQRGPRLPALGARHAPVTSPLALLHIHPDLSSLLHLHHFTWNGCSASGHPVR